MAVKKKRTLMKQFFFMVDLLVGCFVCLSVVDQHDSVFFSTQQGDRTKIYIRLDKNRLQFQGGRLYQQSLHSTMSGASYWVCLMPNEYPGAFGL